MNSHIASRTVSRPFPAVFSTAHLGLVLEANRANGSTKRASFSLPGIPAGLEKWVLQCFFALEGLQGKGRNVLGVPSGILYSGTELKPTSMTPKGCHFVHAQCFLPGRTAELVRAAYWNNAISL